MSTIKMLVDATHEEETRVVIVNGKRLEDFDVEFESKRQLKGNIYPAKVTRVEPSLQAAFVDFGGNRHGFLAFNEIHPDYYQIPIEDREALIQEQRQAHVEADENESNDSSDDGPVQNVGGDDSDELSAHRRFNIRRQYKIQEVIKRRQILLIQVVKEERGNKGAALTTYISLPGRYCVLMPNTARGGGISRKISNPSDRRRLKTILSGFDIPDGVAVIVRTAGSKRTKAEIKRDYDYLMRLWHQVRDTTLESIAPCIVYEEGNLIKRSIRDLYSKEVEEVVVDGNEGYRVAKDFMKLLIPSHAKRVQPHKDGTVPLFHRYQVESQLDAMHASKVSLKSGGYIVLSQTEALVAIDVNSGKATRERNIEETAVRTNIEAADEIARQLRLRDLAGLIVIDFIDMEVHRNQVKVERQLKDSMKSDRARIQMGRISPFGLLELSRQRLRPSFMETNTSPCPHCEGTGALRSVESAALSVLRAIEEEGLRGRYDSIVVHVATPIALYILNQKRSSLNDIETRYRFAVMLASDESLVAAGHKIESLKTNINSVIGNDSEDIKEENKDNLEKDDGSVKKRRRRRTRRRGKRSEEESQVRTISDTSPQLNVSSNDPTHQKETKIDEPAAIKRRRRPRHMGGKRPRNVESKGHASKKMDSNVPSGNKLQDDKGINTDATLEAEKNSLPIVELEPRRLEEKKHSKKGERKTKQSRPKKIENHIDEYKEKNLTETSSERKKKPKAPRSSHTRKKRSPALSDDNTNAGQNIENITKKELNETRSNAIEQSANNVIPKANDITEEVSSEAAKTNIIMVDGEAKVGEADVTRKGGWWRRS